LKAYVQKLFKKNRHLLKNKLCGEAMSEEVLRFINFDNSSFIPNFSHHLGSNK